MSFDCGVFLSFVHLVECTQVVVRVAFGDYVRF